jgi:hypothetical protein
LDEKSSSFLKKRTKRLLSFRPRIDTGHGRIAGNSAEAKVFWFFSSEKNCFLLGENRHANASRSIC